jgi:hypothetical protein
MYDQIEQQLKEQDDKLAKTNVKSAEEAKPETPVEKQEAKPVVSETPSEENKEQNVQTTKEENQNNEEQKLEKEWYELDEEAKPGEKAAEAKPTLEEVKEDDDEDVKLLKEFKKSGKTLKEFVKEFDLPDYANLDEVSIIEMGLKELEGFTGDDYNAAVEEFNQMSLFQRKKLVSEYRNAFISRNEDKLKRLTSAPAKQKEETTQTLMRFQAEVDSIAKELSGKEVYGLKVTDEMSSKIKNFLTSEINLNRNDGSIDADLLADFALWRLYGKDIVRTNVTKAKNSGRREMLEATTNPSDGRGPSNTNNGFQGLTADDAFSSYLNAKKR